MPSQHDSQTFLVQ